MNLGNAGNRVSEGAYVELKIILHRITSGSHSLEAALGRRPRVAVARIS